MTAPPPAPQHTLTHPAINAQETADVCQHYEVSVDIYWIINKREGIRRVGLLYSKKHVNAGRTHTRLLNRSDSVTASHVMQITTFVLRRDTAAKLAAVDLGNEANSLSPVKGNECEVERK